MNDDAEIVPGKDVVDDAFLVVQEGVIAEKMLEGFPGVGTHGLLRGDIDPLKSLESDEQPISSANRRDPGIALRKRY